MEYIAALALAIFNRFADITLAPVMFPPVPDVTKLPTVALPLVLNVPVMLAPVLEIVIFVLPPTVVVTLPFAVAILTLLVPLLILDELIEMKDNPPEPSVLNTCPSEPPVIFTLPGTPRLLTPATVRLAVIDTFDPAILPEEASSVIGPAVMPFFTVKFFTLK